MHKKNSFPINAFPNITNAEYGINMYHYENNLTPKQKIILNMLKRGASLLFDMKAKRAIVLQEVIDGVKPLIELSVRMLSALIKQGFIKVQIKDSNRVHYCLNKNF